MTWIQLKDKLPAPWTEVVVKFEFSFINDISEVTRITYLKNDGKFKGEVGYCKPVAWRPILN